LLVLFSAGLPPINTVGLPGAHGTGVAGMHGMGVKTPSAAAVAAATAGFAGLEHIPKVGNTLSMIVAAGCPQTSVFCCEFTMSIAGAAPKEHMHKAPVEIQFAIFPFLSVCVILSSPIRSVFTPRPVQAT
jgi:hypothetical protein